MGKAKEIAGFPTKLVKLPATSAPHNPCVPGILLIPVPQPHAKIGVSPPLHGLSARSESATTGGCRTRRRPSPSARRGGERENSCDYAQDRPPGGSPSRSRTLHFGRDFYQQSSRRNAAAGERLVGRPKLARESAGFHFSLILRTHAAA